MARQGSILGGAPIYTEGVYVEGETIIEEAPPAPVMTQPAPPSAQRILTHRRR
jgi:hypothetical protein